MKKIIFGGLLSFVLLLSAPLGETLAATYTNQNVTAYTAPSGSKTYHGTTPTKYRTAAVHPRICGSPSSGTRLPYGTVIYTRAELFLPGFVNGYKDDFLVEDMGQTNCQSNLSAYWFDIYFGVKNTTNNANAAQFGKKSGVTYTTH
ncbi:MULTISPECIES: hypothetical protein [Cytobacillus]|uniref:hypothetical protein n=1 Tax=Cytobacillus TaxID=2675230 RepID=UPI001CD4A8BC|nr:hypothetical protein [Cytobacillus kochii]MCA1028883.1 hypothetical protein [Cytobacillus kochii]MCM3324767.1 hypothetical protein [Cytobacillus kochii]MCM3347160.1 hypothetical protein [Cytobacillus kochii]MDM5205638.1 hypothetical protein [Cytobacillus kochii]